MKLEETIHRAIKRHAGLSDWDDDGIAEEVKVIIRALRRGDFLK